ncbi:MAG: lytic transglycosylase domain-containing protein [Dysgonamonadaceae bacterium]|jgi:hypothetical protein|nr:lytic transglycosylase domain-containing protein [Dysgonamonadaceae bacterium]
MNSKTKNTLLAAAFMGLWCYVGFIMHERIKRIERKPPVIEVVEIEKAEEPLTQWQIFTLALIEVESENNPNAVGTLNDGGVLQITPIYIKEANRVQSDAVYTLDDRFDIQKSLEMFRAINDFHNPELNIEKAISIHNPHAPSSYKAKILRKMAEVEKRELIRRYCTE